MLYFTFENKQGFPSHIKYYLCQPSNTCALKDSHVVYLHIPAIFRGTFRISFAIFQNFN
jgi:hypothetical protein